MKYWHQPRHVWLPGQIEMQPGAMSFKIGPSGFKRARLSQADMLKLGVHEDETAKTILQHGLRGSLPWRCIPSDARFAR